MRPAAVAVAAALALVAPAAAARAQSPIPPGRRDLPNLSTLDFDGRYPVRLVTVETARLVGRGEGIVGLGDTRYGLLDHRLEITTNTIQDVLGIANAGLKLGLVDPERSGAGFAVGTKLYWSYGGLIDLGVRKVAESFADVTDSSVKVSGVIGYATVTWSRPDQRTNLHLSVQAHHPFETEFGVQDSVAGGGGVVRFLNGDDFSTMWGADRQLVGRRLVLLMEAGYSWTLEEARLGAAIDTGSNRFRFVLGAMYPGVKTDLATNARDFVVSPTLSVHYRF